MLKLRWKDCLLRNKIVVVSLAGVIIGGVMSADGAVDFAEHFATSHSQSKFAALHFSLFILIIAYFSNIL